KDTNKRYRADKLIQKHNPKIDVHGMSLESCINLSTIKREGIGRRTPHCWRLTHVWKLGLNVFFLGIFSPKSI
ncbi:MAG: hypothetical protein Q8847_02705, partial [Sweet potato little leaf phytoplasma]|nr:hypothetical protein [Sweet potato little leaf phytoplasma]